MQLDHEKLDVYRLALEFMEYAFLLIKDLPRGNSAIADQLTRASTSIVLNIAEGAGKFSRLDKRRYYVSARGSATESAALLDICQRLELIDAQRKEVGRAKLVSIVSMLVRLAQSCE